MSVLVMSVESVSIHSVEAEGGDPLKVTVEWKNNKIEPGDNVDCIVLFTVWDDVDKRWELVEVGRTGYYWGTKQGTVAPNKNDYDKLILYSYAIILEKTNRCGCLVILSAPYNIRTYEVDLGKGIRIGGLYLNDVEALFNQGGLVYAVRRFDDLFTLKPPKPPAEITGCYVEIG